MKVLDDLDIPYFTTISRTFAENILFKASRTLIAQSPQIITLVAQIYRAG
jgi:hypothetical protein